MEIDTAKYQRVLGDELRRLRRQRGYSRKTLQAHLRPVELSVQTLATYELGHRQLGVPRLVQLCAALDAQPQHVLARVHERLTGHQPAEAIILDLPRLAHGQQPELAPLRRWATSQMQPPDACWQLCLARPALASLARLCGLEPEVLLVKLRPYTSRDTPPAPACGEPGR